MNHTECLPLGLNTGFFLRADNADERLTDLAIDIGTAEKERINVWKEKKAKIKNATGKLQSLQASPQKYAKAGLNINQDGKKRSAYSVLGYKDSNWEILESTWPELKSLKLDHKIKKQYRLMHFTKNTLEDNYLKLKNLKKKKS